VDVIGPSGQIHGYDPGLSSNGVVWVKQLPDDSVDINPGAGTASLQVDNLAVFDWVTNKNSFLQGAVLGPPANATISMKIDWGDVSARNNLKEPDQGFAGEFVLTGAHIAVTLRTEADTTHPAFDFVSDPESTSVADFAEIGKERNGVFFP
jgi:hypothetical protein